MISLIGVIFSMVLVYSNSVLLKTLDVNENKYYSKIRDTA